MHVKRAVVVAEDIRFFAHGGVDLDEVEDALERAVERKELPRGASTITQQLAKNLWLTPSRSPLRKGREAILAWQLERTLTKRRILELYLNVAEFGPGCYGVEAAARRYFGKSAADVTPLEAAQLAASLPNPRVWHPGSTGRAYQAYVSPDPPARRARRLARSAPLTGRRQRLMPRIGRVEPPSDRTTAVSTSSGVSGQTGPPGPTTSPSVPDTRRARGARPAPPPPGARHGGLLGSSPPSAADAEPRVTVHERRQVGARRPAHHVDGPGRHPPEGHRAGDVDHSQRRPAVEGGQHRPVVRLEELGVGRRPERGLGGRVDRVEHAGQTLGEAELGEPDLGLGERPQGVADEPRPLPEMGGEPAAPQARRHGRGRGEHHDHRGVPDPAVEPHPDERLHDVSVAGRRRGIERPDRPPVLGPGHGAAGAGTAPVGPGGLGLHAAPGLGGIAGRRHHGQEVRPVPVVEAERRLGQGRGRAIRRRESIARRHRGGGPRARAGPRRGGGRDGSGTPSAGMLARVDLGENLAYAFRSEVRCHLPHHVVRGTGGFPDMTRFSVRWAVPVLAGVALLVAGCDSPPEAEKKAADAAIAAAKSAGADQYAGPCLQGGDRSPAAGRELHGREEVQGGEGGVRARQGPGRRRRPRPP